MQSGQQFVKKQFKALSHVPSLLIVSFPMISAFSLLSQLRHSPTCCASSIHYYRVL
jgi:hypothetical protein